jgi:nitroimidazol reductase NimA-like FMN-containing flavoprotein (pyridoxamine 5'-phosphate oxidase superfamily)
LTDQRSLHELTRAEAMALLASVQIGRLVFTHQALPAIRPVNHLIEEGKIVIGLTPGSAIAATSGAGGTVVAYEADVLDPDQRTGWTVIIVGVARLESDADAAERYRRALQPWLSGAMQDVVTISSDVVTGYRLIPPQSASAIIPAAQ